MASVAPIEMTAPGRDFGKLLVVCIKMLFRRSTRTRFACLLGVFLFTLIFNVGTFVMRLQRTEIQRRDLLEEKAFKVFFLRMRTPDDLVRFAHREAALLAGMGAVAVPGAFIYQNNLYLDVPVPGKGAGAGLELLCDLFQAGGPVGRVFVAGLRPSHLAVFRNVYIDHSGHELDEALRQSRRRGLQRDLMDFTDALRGPLDGRRMAVFNDVRRRLVSALQPEAAAAIRRPDPFVSRVEMVLPLTLCHLFFNLQQDNASDVFDLASVAKEIAAGQVEVPLTYLTGPEPFAGVSLYGQLDIYPRYVPFHAPALLQPRWHWLLYGDIAFDQPLLDRIEKLHARGHYLFSYEKTRMLRDRVDRVRRDLFWNQIQFYLTDLTLGVALPFMMSLFAFVHLKAELAFMLMFRNRIRQLLAIFWLLPLGLMLTVKILVLGGFFAVTPWAADLWGALVLPPAVAFGATAVVFSPINRWCFAQLTGSRLNLYTLHRG